MSNEEFQKIVLQELASLKSKISDDFQNVKMRQDEIYQIVKAIDHSNNVARAELDNYKFRLAKVEGKLRRVAKAYSEDEPVSKLK